MTVEIINNVYTVEVYCSQNKTVVEVNQHFGGGNSGTVTTQVVLDALRTVPGFSSGKYLAANLDGTFSWLTWVEIESLNRAADLNNDFGNDFN